MKKNQSNKFSFFQEDLYELSHYILYKKNEIEILLPFIITGYEPSQITFTIKDQLITVLGNQLMIVQMEIAYMKITGNIHQLTFSTN